METELLPGEPLPVPADLHGVLSSRVAALPADVQDVLLAASCLRSPTTFMLERASGPAAWRALHAAAAEGLVEIEGTRVLFTHPLLASAIYSGVASWRRRGGRSKAEPDRPARGGTSQASGLVCRGA